MTNLNFHSNFRWY